jgi:DNA-binding transcriptional LysR family regulator
MSELLQNWLNNEVGLSTNVSNFEKDFASGFLFGEILHKFRQQDDFHLFVNKNTYEARATLELGRSRTVGSVVPCPCTRMLGCNREDDASAGCTRQRTLCIGAVGPLSKNLQFDFIQPILTDTRTKVVVVAGALDELTRQLHEHKVDLVLSNIPLRADQEQNVFNHLLGEVPVFLVGGKKLKLSPGKFPKFLKDVPLFLPSRQSDVRADFDLILANAGIEPFVHAEVDDMALLRLLALSGEGLALVSKIVIERELQSSKIKFMEHVPGLTEKYYALTVRKRFANAWLGEIVEAFRARLKELAMVGTR